ncbi:MAG: tryptophan--tRNA ligase [Deltaproteobacteria bacterium]|nr:tryptophan--tRNA ligase [Deltaproteobacteria bacterium]
MPTFEPRVLSGMRPTGALHLGHYFGPLVHWIELQNEGHYRCFFFSADWHALTTGYRDTADLKRYRREMIADWLAVGLDPAKVTIFAQAAVPEHAELSTLFGMFTPVPWLERVPSYKETRAELVDRDLSTIGFLGYPLLQTADISIYRATAVPVGEDQVAHVELSREVLRRFNAYYAEIFPEPKAIVSKVRRLPGLDGRKMSKSYNNAIYLTESAEEVKKKVMPAPTDPARVKRTDPGTPGKCNIYAYHRVVQPQTDLEEIAHGCRTAGIGCVDCKKRLLGRLEIIQAPIRAKKAEVMASGLADDVIAKGNSTARHEAQATMQRVREAMGL